jgi:hypothetical protein
MRNRTLLLLAGAGSLVLAGGFGIFLAASGELLPHDIRYLGMSAAGFGSFLAYLGYGYLDTWHGLGTVLLLPVFVVGLLCARRRAAAIGVHGFVGHTAPWASRPPSPPRPPW